MECSHASWQGQAGQTPETHSSHCKWTQKIQHWHSRFKQDQASKRGWNFVNEAQATPSSGVDVDLKKDMRLELALAVKSMLVDKLAGPPKGVNNCLMMMRLPFSNGQKFITIVSAYAPTMTIPGWGQGQVLWKLWMPSSPLFPVLINSSFLVILMWDLAVTALPGKEWLGSMWLATATAIGLLLLQTCTEHGLLITNTIFCLPTHNRTSWMHPHSKHWHLIDYVIIRKRDRQDMQVKRAMWWHWVLDRPLPHHLQAQTSASSPRDIHRAMKTHKCLNVNKLKLSCIKQFLTNTLEEHLDATMLDNQDVESAWAALYETVSNTAMECLRPPTRKHKAWFDENSTGILQLLGDKHHAYKAHLDNPKSTAKKDVLRNIHSTIQLKSVSNAGFMAEQQSWWDPRLCR